jgi:hypothetical protein
MARQQDVLWVRRSEAEIRAVCARALAELGLRPGAGPATALPGGVPAAAPGGLPRRGGAGGAARRAVTAPTADPVAAVVESAARHARATLAAREAGLARRRGGREPIELLVLPPGIPAPVPAMPG